MPATVDIREFNGPSGTPTTKTAGTIQLKNFDDALIESPLAHPVVRPAVGTVYSYEKYIRLRIGAVGPLSAITSPRAYSDGTNQFGPDPVTAKVVGSYTQPVKTASGGSDFFTYTISSPLAMDTINVGPYSGVNVDIADFLVIQATLSSAAPVQSPLVLPEPLTIAYDEI